MSGKSAKKSRTQADRADRHRLYEQSVQNPKAECRFIRKTFKSLRDRPARILREDFCGTAAVSCRWVKKHSDAIAIGVDLDPEVLEWAQRHNRDRLPPDAALRVRLVEADVTALPADEPVDVVLAMNFSYQVFKTREQLRDYFTSVHASLAPDGVFFLDAFGGYEACKEIREVTRYKHFRYIWEHARYDPISGAILCHIHYRFPDGSRIKKAFTYDWRLWTLPELQEILAEAGFSRAQIYWEQVDPETGEGNGKYLPTETGSADPGWVCYLVAEK